jgi:electron transfer flavoprotein beta subunit
MGPSKAVEAIKEALSMGCDRGIMLSAREFAGSDTWATSYVLASAIKKIGNYDLILCGERATDGDTAQVGPGIAGFLDLPLSTFTSEIADITNEKIKVKRLVEGGYELLELELPALLTVVKEISDPRLPTLNGKLRSKSIEIPIWGPEDIGCDPELLGLKGSPTRVVKIFTPKVARQPKKYAVKDDEH